MPERALLPLSQSQRNILDSEAAHPGTPVNVISTTIRIRGRLDLPLLQKTLRLVVSRDPTLRTRLTLSDGEPAQYISDDPVPPVPVYDFTQTGSEALRAWEDAVTRQAMPLYDAPLCRASLFRCGEADGGVLLKLHHVISDGMSQITLGNRIGAVYLDLLAGREPELPESPAYARHVGDEQKYLQSAAHERDLTFWREVFSRPTEAAAFKQDRGANLSPVGVRLTRPLSYRLNHRIRAFCAEERVAPFAVFYMALAVCLHRVRPDAPDRFTLGVPVLGRVSYLDKQTTGMFVSTMPFVGELNEDWSLREFNQNLAESWYDLLRHQRLPFEEIVRLARGQGVEGTLFHVALSYQDSRIVTGRDASVYFSGRWHYSGAQTEQLCIHLTHFEDAGRFTVDYDSLTQLFSAAEIERLHRCLTHLLDAALAEPNRPLREFSLCDAEEWERVVYAFNDRPAPRYPQTLAAALQTAMRARPERVALISGGERTTYQTLLHEAEGLAAAVLQQQTGGVAAILTPRGRPLFVSLCAAVLSGNAFVLIPDGLPEKRVASILRTSGASLVLTDGALPAPETPGETAAPVRVLSPSARAEGYALPERDPDAAYIVFTSGSTGAPKGVSVPSGALLNFAEGMRSLYGRGAVLSVCSVGFDAFLVESLLPLLFSLTVVLAGRDELESPERLAGLVRGYGVGFVTMPPSRLAALWRCDAFAEAARSLETVVCGGEAFPSDLLALLREHTHARIYNQYGPSEATVGVTLASLRDSEHITAGQPLPNCRLYVLDRNRCPLPVGVLGDLYVGGICVANGYLGASEPDEARFSDSPFEPDERLYDTGDLARWNEDGTLSLEGRADGQLKLRGLRVEPEEILSAMRGCPGVTDAAVRVWERDGRPLLCGYYVSAAPLDDMELRAHLGELLPDYMLPACLMRVETIPLNLNGKTDVTRLPEPELERECTRPLGETGRRILAIFRAQLGSDVAPDADYFLCGGDSLRAMETLAAVEKELGLRLRVADLYLYRTARRLAAHLSPAEARALPAAPKLDFYPLSPAQESLYVSSALDPTGLAYHMPGVLTLPASVDRERLARALSSVVERDALLRTAFVPRSGGVAAEVRERVCFSVDTLDAPSLAEAVAAFLRPFDLTAPPLLHAAFWRDRLLLDFHHLICDGVSTPLYLERLTAAYDADSPDRTEYEPTYRDYAFWAANRVPDELADCEQYWSDVLADPPQPLDLPRDDPSAPSALRGETLAFALPPDVCAALHACCEQRGMTPFMLLAATFGLLMGRLSGRDDLLVGTPVSGRVLPELWQMTGPTMQALPLRIRLCADADRYLTGVQEAAVGLLDHAELPLERLVELGGARARGLYEVMFALRPDMKLPALCGQPLALEAVDTHTAKLPLTLEAVPTAEGCTLCWNYAVPAFEPETIAYYNRCFGVVLSALCRGELPDGLRLLTPADRLRLIDRPNRRRTPFEDVPLDRLLDDAALLSPDAAAVRFHGGSVTFAEMADRVRRMAGGLQALGIGRGDRVGVCCARSVELLCSLWAIAKVGGCYVPMLPDYPAARRAYICENADLRLVLADTGEFPVPTAKPASLDGVFRELPSRQTTDLLYILYTSGSTGQPKGVMLPHRALANLLVSISELYAPVSRPVLCSTQVVFDTFITESLLALALGRTVVLADDAEAMLPYEMAALIGRERVGAVQLTPSRLQMCLASADFRAAAKSLELVFLVGEQLSFELQERFFRASDARLVNVYGPTEAAVYVTRGDMARGRPVNIGKPMHNCRVYVLDEHGQPVLPTARGELYLAGECLADGYCGRPDLTAAAFPPDVFFPGGRMYRTGDMGRLRADGSLDCLGRLDAQVKINGQRVELGEVESALLRSGLCDTAAVLAVSDGQGAKKLRAFVTGRADRAALGHYLRAELPSHEIPGEIVWLDALPRTASGKTDLVRLRRWTPGDPGLSETGEPTSLPDPAPVAAPAAPSAEPVPPPKSAPEPSAAHPASTQPEPSAVGKAELWTAPPTPPAKPENAPSAPPMDAAALTALWAEALGHAPQPDVSFFEQGGSSLRALGLLSACYERGLKLTLQTFYDSPTLAAQLAFLPEPSVPTEPSDAGTGAPPSEDAPVRPNPSVPPAPSAPESDAEAPLPAHTPSAVAAETPHARRVLLTGATGYLGAHLLRELLREPEREVVCLTRDGSPDRLSNVLTGYFGSDWLTVHRARFSVVRGDVTLPGLGLESPPGVDAILHAAADTRHFAITADSMRSNRDGAANTAALARQLGAALHHVSTISVSGEFLTDAPDRAARFAESDLDIGQNWRDNVYVRTKLLGEREVYRSGVPARVYRVGRLVGRASDGRFQHTPDQNAFFELIRALRALRVYPARFGELLVDLTPVDLCAEAIVRLMDGPLPVCHVYDPNAPTFAALAQTLCQAEPLDDAAFEARLLSDGSPAARELWTRFSRSGVTIHPTCTTTCAALRLTGFAWPEPDPLLWLREFR